MSTPAMREAVADIDGEVERLNRIVNEVLDFARPIRFELAPTDLNALCRESAAASSCMACCISSLSAEVGVLPLPQMRLYWEW